MVLFRSSSAEQNSMHQLVFSSDLVLLAKLFGPKVDWICVYDPQQRLKRNAEAKLVITDEVEALQQWLNSHPKQQCLFVDLADQPMLEVYCMDNVPFILRFSLQAMEETAKGEYLYINNPDGTIRWLFPAENRTAGFLNLYNSASWKAKLYRMLVPIAFKLGAKRMICNGSFSLFHKGEHPIESLLQKVDYDEYAIFTGTVGENRKAIIGLNEGPHTTHFVKVPISQQTNGLLNNEFQVIKTLEALALEQVEIPSATFLEDKLLLGNVKPKQAVSPDRLEQGHLQMLKELYQKTQSKKRLEDLPSYESIGDHIRHIQSNKLINNGLSTQEVAAISRLLHQQYETLPLDQELPVSLAHQDFTPWNMYVKGNKLYLYDFELSTQAMPLLHDAFHFIFQSNILLKKRSFSVIDQQVKALKSQVLVKEIIQQYDIDFNLHYRYYLLHQVSYYLWRYMRQEDLHLQAHWLVESWKEALEVLAAQGVELDKNR